MIIKGTRQDVIISEQKGFSLLELAIVLMIVGTLMSGVLIGVRQSTDNARRSNARNQLMQVEEAIYGFAQSYGRLPCPATADSGGFEAHGGSPSYNCTQWHGFVPVATLGLTAAVNQDGLMVDPWLNPFRYSVTDDAGLNDRNFTEASELANLFAGLNSTGSSLPSLLCIATAINCGGTIISNTSPAVILSMGPNWATFTSANEHENASGTTLVNGANSYSVSNTNNFVAADYSEELFDDQLVWLSPHVLFNRMISAGKLP